MDRLAEIAREKQMELIIVDRMMGAVMKIMDTRTQNSALAEIPKSLGKQYPDWK